MELFKITGHGIAVGRDNPSLLDAAWKSVDHLSEIEKLLT